MSEAAAICLRRASLPTVPQSSRSGQSQEGPPKQSDPLAAFEGDLELPLEEPKLTWAVDLGNELLALSTVDLWYALNTGSMRPDVKVWCLGREAWTKASDVPELACALRFSKPFIEGEPPRSTLDYATRPPSFGLRGRFSGPIAVSPYDDTPLPMGVLPAPPGLSLSPVPVPCASPMLPCAPDLETECEPASRAPHEPIETWFDMPPLPCQLDSQADERDVEGPLEEELPAARAARTAPPRLPTSRRKRGPKSWMLAASFAASASVAAGISLAATASTPHRDVAPVHALIEEVQEQAQQEAALAITPAALLPAASDPAVLEHAAAAEAPVADVPAALSPPTAVVSAPRATAPSKAHKKTWSPSRRGQARRRQSSR